MKIRNWSKFQHFKDRRPPWIKLHREILEQRDINVISDRSFRILIGLWLLAAEDEQMEGNLPPIDDIQFRLRIDNVGLAKALEELDAFLILEGYQHDIKSISLTRSRETEAETETETEREKKKKKPRSPKNTYGDFVQLTTGEYEKLGSQLGPSRRDDYIADLNNAIGSKGYKYKSHYYTVLAWDRKHKKEHPEEVAAEKKAFAQKARDDREFMQQDAQWKADDPEGYAKALAKEESEREARAQRLQEDLG